MTPTTPKHLLILDPAHGGHDPGALGPNGTKESEESLKICQTMARQIQPLKDRVGVHMLRNSDKFLSLSARARLANTTAREHQKHNPGAKVLYISIHCNSADNPDAHGFEVFTTHGDTGADDYATALFNAFEDDFPDRAGRKDMSDGDPDKEAGFAVLRMTHMPAALFEVGFIHRPEGETFITTQTEAIARALVNGTLAHLGFSAVQIAGTLYAPARPTEQPATPSSARLPAIVEPSKEPVSLDTNPLAYLNARANHLQQEGMSLLQQPESGSVYQDGRKKMELAEAYLKVYEDTIPF